MPTVLSKPEPDLAGGRVRIPAPKLQEISQGAAYLKGAMGDAGHSVEMKIGSKRITLSQPMRDTIQALLQLLVDAALGDVLLLNREAEMTTQEAAAAMGVSRPHVISLIDHGILPARKVGTHRRVKASDVQTYLQSFAKYDERMGPIVSISDSLGGYDLRFPPMSNSRRRPYRPSTTKQARGVNRKSEKPAAAAAGR